MRLETYRKQRNLVPHSLQDTIRLKEIQRLQDLQRPDDITQQDYIDHHLEKQSIWDKEFKPLFTSIKNLPPANAYDSDSESDNSEDVKIAKSASAVKEKSKPRRGLDTATMYKNASKLTLTLHNPFNKDADLERL